MRRLAHVRWLGGGSGAGKSAVARELARRFGVAVYATDDVLADHAARSGAREAPLLHAFLAQSPDERWVLRSPQEMLATFPWFAGEAFGLVVEDLLASPGDRVVVVEGFRLLPGLVRPLLADPDHAVWLLPVPAFRRRVFRERGPGFTARTSDPDRATANLLVRDAAFTDRLRTEVGDRGIAVDGREDLAALTDRVARRFAPVR
ncbi:hypothetical protein GCM10009528_30560 [Kineococcus aurantiacus]